MPIHGIWPVLYIRCTFKALLRALAAFDLGFHDRQSMKVDPSPNIERSNKRKRAANGTYAMEYPARVWKDLARWKLGACTESILNASKRLIVERASRA